MLFRILLCSIALVVLVFLASCGGGSGGNFTDPPGGETGLPDRSVFPGDNPWNQDISQEPVDPNSAALIASIGLSTGLHLDFGTTWNGTPSGRLPASRCRSPYLKGRKAW